jgi:hypothetical protein
MVKALESYKYQEKLSEARANEKKTMSPKKYKKYYYRAYPFESSNRHEKNLCHIIAKANGGADHPLNYIMGDAVMNRKNAQFNDAYYVGLVGKKAGAAAVAISRKLGEYSGPDIEHLWKFAVAQVDVALAAGKLHKSLAPRLSETDTDSDDLLTESESESESESEDETVPRNAADSTPARRTRGVSWHKGIKKWQVHSSSSVKYGRKTKHLGLFDTKKEAIKVRVKWENDHDM